MKILPPVTKPWRQPIHPRRYTPTEAKSKMGHRNYKPYLRWEFGFSCAFCLCHEVDLSLNLATELTEAEHFVPFSHDPKLRNKYENIFYICPLCNRRRSNRRNQGPAGERLLNPCVDTWEACFEAVGDKLTARQSDIHAAYTHRLYHLDDPRKMAMRRHRRETITERRALREEYLELWDRLMRKALEDGDVEAKNMAQALFRGIQAAQKDLELFGAVPANADSVDRQGNAIAPLTLPEALEEQTWSL